MSAGLASKVNGQAALWLNGEPAWHRTGKVWTEADGEITLDRVMQEAGLDFEVEKRPLFVGATAESVMGTERVEIGQSYAIVRNDTNEVLGTVGKVYEPYQNYQAFGFLEELTHQGAASYESAGLLERGARAFVTMRLGEDIVLDPQGSADTIKRWALITTAHNGDGKITSAIVPTRVVCANTLAYGLAGASRTHKVKHTKGGIERLKEAKTALGVANKAFEAFEADAYSLMGMKMSAGQFGDFLTDEVFPTNDDMRPADVKKAEEKRDKAMEIFTVRETNANLADTRWKGLQALTEQIDHFSDVLVPKSLRLAMNTPTSMAKDVARTARVVKNLDEDRKTNLHRALLTWKR